MTGPLAGVVVADFSRVLAGPYATMLLADMGAEVVKVERPGLGDDTRHWGPPFDPSGRATYFEAVNRNKQSVAIDLRSESGVGQALDLIAGADVLVENFSPGTMERFGLGYQQLRAAQPGLIYCSITGFGTGAGRDLPGYDLLVQAVGGLMSITGDQPGHPTKAGVAVVDVITGLHALAGILAALHHRDLTGGGQKVEVNLLSSLLSALVNQSQAYVGAGVVPGIMGSAHPSITPYQAYRAADRPIVVAVGNDAQFRSFCEVLGHPQWADDERFATNPQRVAHRGELGGLIEAVLQTASAAGWLESLTAARIPCGPINDVAEAVEMAQGLGLDPVVEIPRPGGPASRQVANPIHFSETPVGYGSAPPDLPG